MKIKILLECEFLGQEGHEPSMIEIQDIFDEEFPTLLLVNEDSFKESQILIDKIIIESIDTN